MTLEYPDALRLRGIVAPLGWYLSDLGHAPRLRLTGGAGSARLGGEPGVIVTTKVDKDLDIPLKILDRKGGGAAI